VSFVSFVTFVVRVVFVVGALCATVVAFEATLDPRAMEQAIALGLTRIDADRVRFHQPYRIAVNRAPVDWIDVITPFRRVVIETETRTRAGARLLGQREAIEALGPTPNQLAINVELTFHPLNTFIGVPTYEVFLARGSERLAPRETERVPRFGPRVTATPLPYPWNGVARLSRGSEPLLGATFVALFDGALVAADGVYDVVLMDAGKELARAKVNLAAVR
jgi:hypothetical protein